MTSLLKSLFILCGLTSLLSPAARAFALAEPMDDAPLGIHVLKLDYQTISGKVKEPCEGREAGTVYSYREDGNRVFVEFCLGEFQQWPTRPGMRWCLNCRDGARVENLRIAALVDRVAPGTADISFIAVQENDQIVEANCFGTSYGTPHTLTTAGHHRIVPKSSLAQMASLQVGDGLCGAGDVHLIDYRDRSRVVMTHWNKKRAEFSLPLVEIPPLR